MPAGLENAVAEGARAATHAEASGNRGLSKAAHALPTSPSKLPQPNAKRSAKDLALSELAAKLLPLSHPQTFTTFSSKRVSKDSLLAIAREQARNTMADSAIIAHYRDSGIFQRRGATAQQAAKYRDNWYQGKRIPLWAVPAGTDVAIFRNSDDLPAGAQPVTVPDIIGRVIGHVNRKPEGLSFEVPYIRIRADDLKVYEYPALMGGSSRSPHATHPSFAAIDPIVEGQEHGVPTIGWGFPNFSTDPNAGPSAAPDDLNKLAEAILRGNNWGDAVAARNRKAEVAKNFSPERLRVEQLDILYANQNGLSPEEVDELIGIAKSGPRDAKAKARALLSLANDSIPAAARGI